MKRNDYKKRKKKSGKRLAIKITLLITLVAFTAVVGYGAYIQYKVAGAAERAYEGVNDRLMSDLRDEPVEPLRDNVSILLIGVDESEQRKEAGNGRSDALLVATLNNKEKTVKLVSIPRDSYVYVPDRGRKDKINHAHSFGGTRGSMETVEGLLDIPIDYYVKMNFDAFIDVVDAFDGIDIDVNLPEEILELDENDQRTIQLIPGMQHLDGKSTLALARTRKIDNDVERGKRQQDILQAILQEATSIKSVTKYGNVIDAVGDNMKTNMTLKQMMSFLEYAKGGIPDIKTITLEGADDMSTGIYYWMLDEEYLESVKEEIQKHLGVSPLSSAITDGRSTPSTPNESATENANKN